MEKIKIFLVDDHPVVLECLPSLLNSQPDMEVIGGAGDGEEALRLARVIHPDVLILDVSMPVLGGLEAIQMLREALPSGCRILVYSGHDNEAYVVRALNAGALGYVLKGASMAELLAAIRSVHRGDYFLCPWVRKFVVRSFLESHPVFKGEAGRFEELSSREKQVFRLLAEGKTTREIAEVLCISPKTVEKHRVNVMAKLEIQSLAALMKYALRIGVLDPDFWKR